MLADRARCVSITEKRVGHTALRTLLQAPGTLGYGRASSPARCPQIASCFQPLDLDKQVERSHHDYV